MYMKWGQEDKQSSVYLVRNEEIALSSESHRRSLVLHLISSRNLYVVGDFSVVYWVLVKCGRVVLSEVEIIL